ncbi:hypothetical protein [Sorangium sp. So ce887]|uniref:hypothetical protein n=1 Tax=Sorangium sp. So ce887 TaxID=3133324 RepID=UPI003F6350DD
MAGDRLPGVAFILGDPESAKNEPPATAPRKPPKWKNFKPWSDSAVLMPVKDSTVGSRFT